MLVRSLCYVLIRESQYRALQFWSKTTLSAAKKLYSLKSNFWHTTESEKETKCQTTGHYVTKRPVPPIIRWIFSQTKSPGVTGKFGLGMRNEAGQRLTEFCQENALVIANTLFQQHKRRLHMDITRWSTPKSDWLYSLQPKMEKLYTVNKNKTGSWLWLRSWTPYCQIQTQIEESRENC